jgi:pyruvate dehydrogenase E2 component (dihydrolipoamide acetyltransferase)
MAAGKAPPLPDFSQWGPVERVPMRSVRRATAKHMALAWSQIPHVSHQDVADITELEAFRQKHKKEIEKRGGSLSMTVFALKAAVAALRKYPSFNSTLDTESGEIILKRYYHVGVAVDTERGLIVPVIRDVDRKSITELAVELPELARRMREGKVDREEMAGGSFTITNIGPLGGTAFAPIVNYPQVAILGMARARLQPVVRGSADSFEVVPRLMLPLILGFDHRVVDGADAARFIGMIIEELQSPENLLLNI